jgi:hypothetical protein
MIAGRGAAIIAESRRNSPPAAGVFPILADVPRDDGDDLFR